MRIFSILTIAILLSLGTWQVKRLIWKEKLISDSNNVILELPKELLNYDIAYKTIYLTGILLNEKTIFLYSGTKGFHIITPMKLLDNRIILVNRGIVQKRVLPYTQNHVPQSIFGTILPASAFKKVFMVENDITHNYWYYLNIEEISKYTQLELIPYILRMESSDTPTIYNNGPIKVRNDHLGYAITWYTLALVLVLVTYKKYKSVEKSDNSTNN